MRLRTTYTLITSKRIDLPDSRGVLLMCRTLLGCVGPLLYVEHLLISAASQAKDTITTSVDNEFIRI